MVFASSNHLLFFTHMSPLSVTDITGKVSTPVSVINGKIHSIRKLHAGPIPLEFVPQSINLFEEYKAGRIAKEFNRNRWYDARKRLRVYGLISDPQKKDDQHRAASSKAGGNGIKG